MDLNFDINGDGKIDEKDVIAALTGIVSDGKVDVTDLAVLGFKIFLNSPKANDMKELVRVMNTQK